MTRADWPIAKENPPKKYQDINYKNFDNDPGAFISAGPALPPRWIDHGVTLFRVDNPHRLLDFGIPRRCAAPPEVIFLSEAFTRPT